MIFALCKEVLNVAQDSRYIFGVYQSQYKGHTVNLVFMMIGKLYSVVYSMGIY